ncbi:MAG: lytic transglycosylase domain-containing protein [Deltaproteobacteria bacterium]|nr:lytic transglycosylase domain-containing protein [Deltaproteobacteria bacterium]
MSNNENRERPANYLIFALIPALCLFLGSNGCVFNPAQLEKESLKILPGSYFLGEPGHQKPDFQLPSSVSLCGQALPLERPSVRERLDAEFLLAVNHPAQVRLWQRRARRFFPTIEAALKASGLPDDLKYLSVAESDLRPSIFSPAGAAGIWQFIPSTARRYGLKVNKREDQRLLPEPVMGAGLRYLSFLNDKFGDWALAMASYNAGEARIGRAMAEQGTADYYQLRLPRETERYVYRIVAIKIVMERPERWGLEDNTPPGLYLPQAYRETTEDFTAPQTWAQLAAKFKCDYKTLRALNPHLANQETLSGGSFVIRSPKSS